MIPQRGRSHRWNLRAHTVLPALTHDELCELVLVLFQERSEGDQSLLALVPRLRAPCGESALGCGDSLFQLLIGRDGDVREGFSSSRVDDRDRGRRGGRFAINDMSADNVRRPRRNASATTRREQAKDVDTNKLVKDMSFVIPMVEIAVVRGAELSTLLAMSTTFLYKRSSGIRPWLQGSASIETRGVDVHLPQIAWRVLQRFEPWIGTPLLPPFYPARPLKHSILMVTRAVGYI